MADRLTVALEDADGPYRPGDVVRATVTVAADGAVDARGGRAGLVCVERYQQVVTVPSSTSAASGGSLGGRPVASPAPGQTTTWTERAARKSAASWFRQETLWEGTLPAGFHRTFRLEWPVPADAVPSPAGDLATVRWVVKATVDRPLAGDVLVRPGEPAAFPFRLTVPPRGAPSFVAAHSKVGWRLRATLDRTFAPDHQVQREVVVHGSEE